MTTPSDIARFVSPLLARHPDLVPIGERCLVMRPVRHALRCLCIGGTARDDLFRPCWGAIHLFERWGEPDAVFGGRTTPLMGHEFGFVRGGDQIVPRGESRAWRIDTPDLEAVFCTQVEEEVLPRLRAVETLADYVAQAARSSPWADPMPYPGSRLFVHVAMGELAAARALCARYAAAWAWRTWGEMQPFMDMWSRMADRVRADDRAGMIALLHEREADMVARLRIDHLWERTPFPLEGAG